MSYAKKKREHLIRNGKPDPASSRGSWFGINPFTRRTPTKQSLINKAERKYKDVAM